ncbi:MAG: DNA-binding protein [Alphaproteobacteria bacterium]
MALFFDSRWFDARLSDIGADRDQLAAHLGLTRTDIDMIFKDQRELTQDEVASLAQFLNRPVEEVVDKAGIATPKPSPSRTHGGNDQADRLHQLERRVALLEKQITALTHQLHRQPD